MGLMQINKFIEADLTYIVKDKKYDDKCEYMKASFSFAEQIFVLQKCSEEGFVLTDSWNAETIYNACKLDGDVVMIMNPKIGWVRAEIATEKYANILAERELLK